jgi:hypothetical protein
MPDAQNKVFERFARAGYVMNGLVHLLIGYIAIRLALGGRGGSADQSGALAELAAKPGGTAAMWVAVVAFSAMALWRLVETAVGRSSDPDSKKVSAFDRIKSFSLALVYAAFALSAFGFARGGGKSSGEQNSGISARLMSSTAGTALLIVAALVIIGVGGYHVYKGASKNFLKDLEGATSDFVRWLGIAGYIAKGSVIAGVGVVVIIATINSDPEKATGLDGALKTLGAQAYGVALLVIAGIGLITYGLYSFVMARFARM